MTEKRNKICFLKKSKCLLCNAKRKKTLLNRCGYSISIYPYDDNHSHIICLQNTEDIRRKCPSNNLIPTHLRCYVIIGVRVADPLIKSRNPSFDAE